MVFSRRFRAVRQHGLNDSKFAGERVHEPARGVGAGLGIYFDCGVELFFLAKFGTDLLARSMSLVFQARPKPAWPCLV